MQTPVQGDLARIWRHWRRIWMDPRIRTLSCCRLGIRFPHRISRQARSSPIVLKTLLHLSPASVHSQRGFSFINFLVYSVCLFSLTLSFHTLFGVFFSKLQTSSHSNSCFLFILILVFSCSHINSQKIKILLKRKNKTSILTGGRWWSPLLLTFSRTILGPLHVIPTFFFPNHSPEPHLCSIAVPILSNWAVFLSWPSTKSQLLSTPPQAPGVLFQWHLEPCHK